jgi:hypothetical protein
VVTTEALRAYHQDEIGPFRKCVGYSESVEGADKDVTSFLVLLQLSLEELALGCLFETSGGSFLKRGIRAEHNPGAGRQSWAYDGGGANQPAYSPPSSGE